MKTNLIIGTRQSLLALWQSNHIADLLRRQYPECTVTLKKIITKGDRILDVPLAKIGGKGLFTKELETALLEDAIDLAAGTADEERYRDMICELFLLNDSGEDYIGDENKFDYWD